jgi:branched-chain amino acid transport system ATP-binding protein
VVAARSVDLEVDQGEIVALLGPIGAGKSTVLCTVMGLHQASEGKVVFEGAELNGASTDSIVRRGLALVPERRRIFAELTVAENLRLGCAARSATAPAQDDLDRVLELFPILAERLHGTAGYLSGGEAQQLAIARALMGKPRLLLLDEPSLGLAPKVTESVFALMTTLRDAGLTVLIVEQNAFQALEVADRGYVLQGGRIEASGSAASLLQDRRLIASYLGARREP